MDHSVAESAPTLALSGDAACAFEHDAAVLTNTCFAHVDGAPGHVPRAQLQLCARVVLGVVAANMPPRPVRAGARGLQSAPAGQMARRRLAAGDGGGAQKIRELPSAYLEPLGELCQARRRGRRRAARRRWARSQLEPIAMALRACGGRRRLQRGQRPHRHSPRAAAIATWEKHEMTSTMT